MEILKYFNINKIDPSIKNKKIMRNLNNFLTLLNCLTYKKQLLVVLNDKKILNNLDLPYFKVLVKNNLLDLLITIIINLVKKIKKLVFFRNYLRIQGKITSINISYLNKDIQKVLGLAIS